MKEMLTISLDGREGHLDGVTQEHLHEDPLAEDYHGRPRESLPRNWTNFSHGSLT